jgi:squalene-associated FAD-dependent desaturase
MRSELPDVIVIGAGFAGLSAAAACAERGARVLVLEARPRLGGRATSHTDPTSGEQVDNGQHVLMGCYRETFEFLKRVGAESHVRVQPALEVPFVDSSGERSMLSCPLLPSPFHLLGGLVEWRALGLRDKIAVFKLGPSVRLEQKRMAGRTTLRASSVDETVDNWLIRNWQTPRLREMLWTPLALAALNQLPSDAAAETFVRVLAEMFGSDPRASALALPLCPLDEMYAEPARAFIEERGGEVRANAPARIAFNDGRVSGVVLRNGDEIHAGQVISAVPWFDLGELFVGPPAALADIIAKAARTGSSPIVTVNLWFDRRVSDSAFVGLPNRTLQWLFDTSAILEKPSSHVSLVSSGAEAVVAWTNQSLIDVALREVREALPPARDASVRHASVVRERRATFSLAPGQPPRPGTATPVEGLCLAGDWTDTGLPGTIESAVVSGHRAARFVSGQTAGHS